MISLLAAAAALSPKLLPVRFLHWKDPRWLGGTKCQAEVAGYVCTMYKKPFVLKSFGKIKSIMDALNEW